MEHTPPVTALPDRAAYLAAVDTATRAAQAYYHGDGTELDDATYDALVRGIAAAETANPDWVIAHGLLDAVAGGTSTAGDVAHAAPMLSLDNVFSSAELEEWAISRTRLGQVTSYCVEPKFDGLSVAATYRSGRLVRLATRGNGQAGEDVTYALGRLVNLPTDLQEPLDVEVRGEVLFSRDAFEEANAARIASGKSAYVNARNAAAGALRAESLGYDVRLSFFAHGQVGLDAPTHAEALAKLAAAGVPVGAAEAPMTVHRSAAQVAAAVEAIAAARATLPFEIDGAVVKVNALDEQAVLGFSSRAPRWGIAVKFPAEEVYGTVSAIEVQVGRLGTITPVAKLHPPVFVGGTHVSSVTLHNFDDLAKRDVRVGDVVVVRRAGDVIPEIVRVRTEDRPADRMAFGAPSVCPRCGADIDRTQVRWRCTRGRDCGLVEALVYAASRDCLDIEGLGEKVVAQLVAAGHVADVADLFTLRAEQLNSLDRMGELSTRNLLTRIDAARALPLHRVFAALGVRMTGRSMSRRLARRFGSMTALRQAGVVDLAVVEGVGPERAQTIVDELLELAPVIDKLLAAGVNMVETGAAPAGDGPLAGKTVVVTGNLGSLTRSEAQGAVERLGGRPTSSVTKKTDLLVVGDAPGASKVDKAAELGVTTMSGTEFLALLDN
jgi:DNA ligase (NAD+)